MFIKLVQASYIKPFSGKGLIEKELRFTAFRSLPASSLEKSLSKPF